MKTLFLFLLLAATNFAEGQINPLPSTLEKEHYLKEAQTFKMMRNVTGFSGLTLFSIGTIMFLSEMSFTSRSNEKKSNTGETLAILGGGLIVISIPLDVAYRKNKKRAASLSFNNKPMRYLNERCIATTSVAMFSLKIQIAE